MNGTEVELPARIQYEDERECLRPLQGKRTLKKI